ncbi:PC-esterase domain-containing protein 1B-like [Lineus longissimus]|uniref:PC-esterase domain-containing protein 1B-like n=1 Tax=Lineus longissimus TaxID=88925 RepID=UPI002B4C85D3
MAGETYTQKKIVELLTNKFIVVIGDSVQRSVYKDLVVSLQQDRYLSHKELKDRGEPSFLDDMLCEGGKMHNGTHYREVRQFQHKNGKHIIRYYFVTKAYNDYWETIFEDIRRGPKPDVVLMNSCLWDMNRYGPSWLYRYQENLDRMLNGFKEVLPEQCLVIWNTCMPVGKKARGGFMSRKMQSWRGETIRYDVLEANFTAKQAVKNHGYDCLDLNFNFRQIRGYQEYRQHDDVHWNQHAHRMISNLILGHIADAWGVPKPKFMRPLDVDLKPRALRKHGRSHTIDSRCVEVDRGYDRKVDVTPRCRIVELDMNNNANYNLNIGSKRKRVEPKVVTDRLLDEDFGRNGRRRRLEEEGMHQLLHRHSSRDFSPQNSPALSLLPNSQRSPLLMPMAMNFGWNQMQQINQSSHVSGFSLNHPANQMMAIPLAQQMGMVQSPVLFNCVNASQVRLADFFPRQPATQSSISQMMNGSWQNGQYF